jgi:hypothetical protein
MDKEGSIPSPDTHLKLKHKNMDAKEYFLIQLDAIKAMVKLDKFTIEEAKAAINTTAFVALYMEKNNINLKVGE